MRFCGAASIIHTGIAVTTQLTSRPQGSLVIVVDDDAAVRNSLKFSLDIEGFVVRLFSNSDELLNSSDLAACRCFVIDQRLPGMTGLELLALLRKRDIATPAILVTTHPDATVRKTAREAGVPIVEKPFLENALLEHLLAAIGSGGQSDIARF